MKRKFSKKAAAFACAVLMSSQAMAFSVSAEDWYYYYNGVYYSSPYAAAEAAGNNYGAYESVLESRIPSSASVKYYDPITHKMYDTYDSAVSAGVVNPQKVYVGTYYAYNYNYNYDYNNGYYWYCSLNGKYYKTYEEALRAANNQSKYVTYRGGTWYNNGYNGYWYSSYTGNYYSTYEEALSASRGVSSYVTYMGGYYGNYDYWGYNNSYYGYGGYWYSSYTKKYYTSYSDALTASRGNASYLTFVGNLYSTAYNTVPGSIYRYYYNGVAYPTLEAAKKAGGTVGVDIYISLYGSDGNTGYYYYYNGTYYGTLDAAKKAGGTALGVDITYVPYNYYGNAFINSPYGMGYNSYTDPYYAFRNTLKDNNVTTKNAEDGEPYIYGKKNRAGWKTVITYIKNASKGDTVNVDMNGCNVIDADVLSALKGKNVNLNCVLSNGVKWNINGNDVVKAKDMVIYTEYNIDYVPRTLVNKALKDAVSSAQVGISTDFGALPAEANVTVRFASKRAGCNAVVYCYDPASNSLKGVYKSKVQSDGNCTFTVDEGGPYLIVLK